MDMAQSWMLSCCRFWQWTATISIPLSVTSSQPFTLSFLKFGQCSPSRFNPTSVISHFPKSKDLNLEQEFTNAPIASSLTASQPLTFKYRSLWQNLAICLIPESDVLSHLANERYRKCGPSLANSYRPKSVIWLQSETLRSLRLWQNVATLFMATSENRKIDQNTDLIRHMQIVYFLILMNTDVTRQEFSHDASTSIALILQVGFDKLLNQ